MITEITGTKTLTDSTIARLKSYGYSFEVVAGQQEI
jgi:ribosome maturation protein Sdo1